MLGVLTREDYRYIGYWSRQLGKVIKIEERSEKKSK